MLSFVTLCGLTFIAALLGATGGSHLIRLPSFVRLLRGQGLVPSALAVPAALAVTGAELAIAAAAVAPLAGADPWLGTAAFAAALTVGLGFAGYLRELLRSGHTGSCGCTPIDGPLTPASFGPALALAIFGALGLGASLASPGIVAPPSAAWGGLAGVWGLTLAGLVLLLPASAPGKAPRQRRRTVA